MTSNGPARPAADTYEKALRLLEFRARAVAELRRKLLQKGEPAAAVDEAIARLIDQKILDDAAFAHQFARTKALGAGASRFRIVQELGRKGVRRDVAERAVADLAEIEGIDPSATIHRVAEKKLRTLMKLDARTRRHRLYAFLARRGFNPDEIRAALAQLGETLDE
jgi:regulatory protein